MSDRDTLTDAMNEAAKTLASLAGVQVIPTAGKNKGESEGGGLREWLEGYLLDGPCRAGGNALTRIMRLPDRWQAALLECIKDEGGYGSLGSGPLAYRARIRNVSGRPIRVMTGERHVLDPVQTLAANFSGVACTVGGSTGRWVQEWATIAPGEERTLSAKMAIHALFDNCKEAHSPTVWGTGAYPKDNDLLEVGYTCSIHGEPIAAPLQAEPEPSPPRRGRPPKDSE